jgi:hypothetical protein
MNFKLLLTVLTKHQVEFVVVGGVAVVAHEVIFSADCT